MLKRSLHILLVAVVGVVLGVVAAPSASALEPNLNNQPGVHFSGGRYWNTECELTGPGNDVVRCETSIWGTKPVVHNGTTYNHPSWVLNNVTYLPAPAELWAGNPLATTGGATACSATQCVTRNAGEPVTTVYFSSATVPHQTTVLPKATTPAGAPVERPFVPPVAATVYTQPGDHLVNGRYWKTDCSMYSSNVVRCSTDIWGTKVIGHGGKFYTHNGWAFNSMTYLPAPRETWGTNPLANHGSWTAADGRQWSTLCDTAETGRGACRSYVNADVVSYSNGTFTQSKKLVLNNIINFSNAHVAHQKTILPTAPARSDMPVEQPFQVPSSVSFRPDSRCMTGRVLCVSKNQRKMAWMVNGTVLDVVDVRFGREGTQTQTRNGIHYIGWKSRNHVSSIYKTPMPFALFFDGGQAVHYSSNFARNGWNGTSGGCVNVRDYDTMKKLFDTTRVGDKVVVYY